MIAEILAAVSVWAIPVILAITLHEAAHAWTAWKLGDDTAFRLGRVSFNPIRHVDLFGTLILPAVMLVLTDGRMVFGFAKPVPVHFGRLRRPRPHSVLVAAAGPGMNLALALVAAAALHGLVLLPPEAARWVGENLLNALWINVLLAVFNMLPLPPLDGGRVAVGLLPTPLARPLARLEPAGLVILLGVLFLLPLIGQQLGYRIAVFEWLVAAPAQAVSGAILTLVGVRG